MTSPATRRLGRDGPLVSAIGFGAMSIGVPYGQQSSADSKQGVLDRAWEIGERFWDTADVYADSEDTIGEWFKRSGKRSDIFLATKFGLQYTPDFVQSVRSDPDYVHEACERSLKRLGVDTIDLLYCHRVDGKTPIEKTIEAMVELKNQGKIRHIGLSEVSAATIRRAHAVHPIAAVQVEYSLFYLDIESSELGILDICRELGISVVAYSPVGRGLLTGQIKSFDDLPEHDFRRLTPKYSRENFPTILKLVAEVEALSQRHDCTPAQVCLAWLLGQGEDVVPIPGTRTIKFLEENTTATQVHLTSDEIQELRAAAEAADLPGDRYPTAMMGPILGDTPPL